jgi:Icc-related predicted phosphoesterase
MRIMHVSDTHGELPELIGRFDIIVHSGDFFPNSKKVFSKNKKEEISFQENWLNSQINNIKEFCQNLPFLFILGNHDFIDPDKMEDILKENGINAINLTNKFINFSDIHFYGFPYIPYIKGLWNYEKTYQAMQIEIQKMADIINEQPHFDILVSHSPIYGVLDRSFYNQNIGNSSLLNAIEYGTIKNLPQYILCGHCHEDFGVTIKQNMIISNAAETQNIIRIF